MRVTVKYANVSNSELSVRVLVGAAGERRLRKEELEGAVDGAGMVAQNLSAQILRSINDPIRDTLNILGDLAALDEKRGEMMLSLIQDIRDHCFTPVMVKVGDNYDCDIQ